MPTRDPWKNSYRVGDVVTMVHYNGTGEGVLWRVFKVNASWVHLEAFFTVTGVSVLRPKRVQHTSVQPVDVVQLCTARAQLDNIINDIVKLRSGEANEDHARQA